MWYSTGLFAVPVRWVLIRDPEGEFKTQALLCTDLEADPKKILSWFVMRWQLEVTFQEVRRHLGFETQTPVVGVGDPKDHTSAFGAVLVWSPCSRIADETGERAPFGDRRPGTTREHPTFADALALVRKELWAQEEQTFCGSPSETDTVKVPRAFVERLTDAVCYAA